MDENNVDAPEMKKKFIEYAVEMDAWNAVTYAKNIDKKNFIKQKIDEIEE